MALRIENNIVNDKSEQLVKTPVQQEQKQDVIPVGQKEETKTDSEKPVEGYYIEKTSQEPASKPDNKDDDDDIDTNVDPNARINILPSIAINKTTNEITSVMEQAVNRAMTETFLSSSDDSYFKAQIMVQDNRSYKCFDEINYTKNFNIHGKAVYEGNFQKYTDYSLNSEIKLSRNSEKFDLGLYWKNKSENTKMFAFGSYTHSDQKLAVKTSENTTEQQNPSEEIDGSYKYDSYSVFGAVQHRFKNGDTLTGGGFHINDVIHDIKTTSFDASYYYRKFMVLAEGKTTIYKVVNKAPVTKTDFSISLNPELAIEEIKEETPEAEKEASAENETAQEQKIATKPDKKWSKAFSPFFDTQSLAGDTEEGLGIKFRLKRTDDKSNFRVSTFGKVSTTHQEESNKYHVTFGSGIKYAKNLGAKSYLKAEAEIKDRVTFGQENILTATAHALFTSPKFSAEAEAKKILISGEQPSYAAIVGRAYYTPTKNINLYTEASYTKLKERDTDLKGANIQAGVIVNF